MAMIFVVLLKQYWPDGQKEKGVSHVTRTKQISALIRVEASGLSFEVAFSLA
jgi:hypothetical protein